MNGQSYFRIVVTENNPALLDGLVALIECQSDMHVVGTSSDARQAFDEFHRARPSVVIVDVDVPDSIHLMKRVRRERPETRVIALVNYEWDSIVHAALEASGSPCLPKDHISRHLLGLIRTAGTK